MVGVAGKAEAEKLIESLNSELNDFKVIVDNQDRQAVPIQQQKCLSTLGNIEELMVGDFPYDIPKEYASYPLLKGRATVELKVTLISISYPEEFSYGVYT